MNAAQPEPRLPSRPEGSPTGLTCPQCGGAIWEQASAETLRFRCRIGHELSLGAMLAEHGHAAAAERLAQEAVALDEQAEAVLGLATSALVPTPAET